MKRVAMLVLVLASGAAQAYGQSATDSLAAMSSALTHRATPEGAAIFVTIGRGPTAAAGRAPDYARMLADEHGLRIRASDDLLTCRPRVVHAECRFRDDADVRSIVYLSLTRMTATEADVCRGLRGDVGELRDEVGPTICRQFEKNGDRWVFVRELVRFGS